MHLPPKIIRLGYSTRSTIEEHTDMFNLFFYILCFNNFQPRYKLFFQVVRNLLAKIVVITYLIYKSINHIKIIFRGKVIRNNEYVIQKIKIHRTRPIVINACSDQPTDGLTDQLTTQVTEQLIESQACD